MARGDYYARQQYASYGTFSALQNGAQEVARVDYYARQNYSSHRTPSRQRDGVQEAAKSDYYHRQNDMNHQHSPATRQAVYDPVRYAVKSDWERAKEAGRSVYNWGKSKVREAENIHRNWTKAFAMCVRSL